jgi:putative membrane protein
MLVRARQTWIKEIFTYRGTVLPRIWRRLLFIAGLSVALTLGQLEVPGFIVRDITPLPFTLIGFALSVFLGFRTSTAYNRFWEGRTLWGALVNTCRNLTRQVHTWLGPQPGGPPVDIRELREHRRRLVHHTIAFSHALRQRLRDEDDIDAYAALLDPPLRAALARDQNRPQAIAAHLGEQLRQAYEAGLIHPLHVALLEANLVAMTDIQGGCERIGSTPLPYVYRVLVHQIVGLYCFSLPFGVLHTLGWFAPAVSVLVSYAFFGLDAIGDELDNPFEVDANDLPLSALSRGIEIDLRARIGETDLPAAAEPHHGLLL